MSISSPHYLLFSEARHTAKQDNAWRFVLESVNSQQRLAAADVEPHAGGERLELLAVVRGLEAIDCPARVTLITKSRYVSRGLKYGMNEWRAKNWQWERFGKIVPVRDHDLWRRVDRALQFHQVQCRAWQFASKSNPVATATAGHETALSGHRAEATLSPGEPSSRSTHENLAVASPRKANQPVPRRRTDPSHLSRPSRPVPADSQSPSKRPIPSRKVPARNTPSRIKDLARQFQDVMARLKWSLSTWLSEHPLHPLT